MDRLQEQVSDNVLLSARSPPHLTVSRTDLVGMRPEHDAATPTMQQSGWARLCCANKAPRPQGPKTTKVYFLFTLQVRRGGREALAPQGVTSGPRKRPGRWPWQRHTWPQKDT